MEKREKEISVFLSLILRHKPDVIGIQLDREGYADTQELLKKMNLHGRPLTFEKLQEIVAKDSKGRYSFNEDKTKIRANQGHSIVVDLNLESKIPPDVLYHGTAMRNISSILKEGIQKRSRQYVHLSMDIDTAIAVGKRHGKPIVLKVDSAKMVQDGYMFYQSKNKVWLTEFVPKRYIEEV